MTITATDAPLMTYLVRLADDNVVLGQRLSEYIGKAPDLEEDLAVANIGLDHIGIAQHLYSYAAEVEGAGRTEDDFAFWRTERQFTNTLLVEQPHEGFGELIARQFLFDAYQLELWEALSRSSDDRLAGIAAKALKEARYHLRHTASWVVRLGDGTDESHRRMQDAIDAMWRFTGSCSRPTGIRPIWQRARRNSSRSCPFWSPNRCGSKAPIAASGGIRISERPLPVDHDALQRL